MDRGLVDHLVNANVVSRNAMQRLILRASRARTTVVGQLLEQEAVDAADLSRELAEYYDVSEVDRSRFSVDATALQFLPREMADQNDVLPFDLSDTADRVRVAVVDPDGAREVLETLKTATGNPPEILLAPRDWLRGAIRHFYFDEEWDNPEAIEPEPRSDSVEAKMAEPPETPGAGVVGDRKALEDILGKIKPRTRSAAGQSGADIVRPEIKQPVPGRTTEESAEIVLDEVVSVPAPAAERSARAKSNGRSNAPAGTSKRSAVRKPKDSVEAALEDFDAFLDNNKGSIGSGSPGMSFEDSQPVSSPTHKAENVSSAWGADSDSYQDAFSFEESEAKFTPPARRDRANGFDLFDEPSEAVEPEASLQQIVDRQGEQLAQLQEELEQSRDVIKALVDLLADGDVISKRALKAMIKKR